MTGTPNNWQNLYPPEESRWQDMKRRGKFISLISFVLFFLSLYIIGYAAICFGDLVQLPNNQGVSLQISVRTIILFLQVLVVIAAGLFFISQQMKNFIVAFYKPKADENLAPLIYRKLFGVPPTPPLLSNFINYPFIVIREPSTLAEDHWTRWFGGPATLVVYDGVAVYIERGNIFSRVIGPGLPFLERNERIRDIVDLRPQTKIDSTRPWTKDGIRIKLTIRAELQIHADQDAIKKSAKLRYPFDPIAVKKAVEYSSIRLHEGKLVESFWLDGAWGSITGLINQFVAGHSLDELFLAPEAESGIGPNHQESHSLESIEQLLSGKISRQVTRKIQDSLQRSGINLLDLQITDIEVPKEIRELRMKYWESIKEKISAHRNSHAEAERIRARELAHAEAQRTMLLAITKKLENIDPEDLTESLILSLSGILDQGLDDPIVRPLIAKESFAVLERMRKLLEDRF